LNWYYSGGETNTYIDSAAATNYSQEAGTHRWFHAASGTAGGALTFSESMRIDSSGNVGIGTTSPDTKLHISDTVGGAIIRLERNDTTILSTNIYGGIEFEGQDGSAGSAAGVRGKILGVAEGSTGEMALTFETAGGYGSSTERMRIDSSGNVGIGTTSPSTTLEVASGSGNTDSATNSPTLRITNKTDDTSWETGDVVGTIEYYSSDASGNAPYVTSFIKSVNELNGGTLPSGALTFGTATYNASGGAVERVRIDTSGNLLVGNTDSTPYDRTSGNAIALGDGLISSAQSGGNAAIFNRMTSNGSIAGFRYAGDEVGSWGSYSSVVSYLVLDPRTNGTGIIGLTNEIAPTNELGNPVDGAKDLGDLGRRWKDLYLSGGVVFGATGGNVTSKTLDDYEEGTWTPTISSGGWTMSTISKATYTKIGNRVVVQTFFDITGTGNGTDLVIGGLPFTCASNAYSASAADIDRNSLVGTYARVLANSSTIEFFTASGSTATSRTKLIGTSIGAGYIIFNVIYEAA